MSKKRNDKESTIGLAPKPNQSLFAMYKAKKVFYRKWAVRTAIKHDLSQDFNLLDYSIWGVLEKKPATSHSNIRSSNATIEDEWNKMEFILKVRKSFRRCDDTITEKIAAILSKFIVLCLSHFVGFFKNKN